jgi:hypothetical protein
MMARTRLDDEVRDLLADEPELLAIADAVAETQQPRRRVRPLGVAAGVALVAAAVVAFAFWSGGGSNGISGDTAYAAIGGAARVLEVGVAAGDRRVVVTYDRAHGRLTAAESGQRVGVPAIALPPEATTLPASFERRFGGLDIGPVVSLLAEYPGLARAGKLARVEAPPHRDRSLRWVSYRSSLGYVVEVGLGQTLLQPVEVARAGAAASMRVLQLSTSN